MNPWAGYRMGPSPTSTSLLTLKPGVKKSSFQISANHLEVVENFIQHILGYIG